MAAGTATCEVSEVQKLQLLHYAAILLILFAAGNVDGTALSFDHYKHSCPEVETIVSRAILPIFITDPSSPSAFLRLLFHDCQVQGCDASVLIESDRRMNITSETESSKNFGLRGLKTIETVKSFVELMCPGTVSCADVLALAAREAVAYSGGPYISIPFGRKDAVTASNIRADAKLPSSSTGVDDALQIFMSKGMSIEESVAILGGHTIGSGHCLNIVRRLYTQQEQLENIDTRYQAYLRLQCPTEVPLTNLTIIFNDLTPLIFDNQYFKDIVGGRGLFTVDSAISIDPRTAQYVSMFAENQDYFFRVFSSAFVKLSSAAVLTGKSDEIRRKCSQVN